MALNSLSFADITACIISTVVPQALFNLRNLSRRYVDAEPMVIGEDGLKLGIEVRIDKPNEAGADRLVNAVGAFIDYGGPSSSSTAALPPRSTSSALTAPLKAASSCRGSIFRCRRCTTRRRVCRALKSAIRAASLARTRSALCNRGFIVGSIDMIEGLCRRIRAEYGKPMKTIATGGVASLFEGAFPAIDHFDQDLTSRGLLEIFRTERRQTLISRQAERRTRFPAAGRLGRDRHEFERLRLRPAGSAQWIIVDIGVTFGREEHDAGHRHSSCRIPTYLEGEKDNIIAIVLTHAHEDHIGALGWLWPRLKAPVYATPFTAALVREKLREHDSLLDKVPLTEIPLKGKLTLGPFEIDFVTLTHSIPEPNGLAIRTPLGLVWHTGDWKIDPDPLIGETTDEATLRAMADEGVLAMVCDSTNVFVEGHGGLGSRRAREAHRSDRQLHWRVAVTAFASNVARVETAILAARAAGPNALFGRTFDASASRRRKKRWPAARRAARDR